MHLSSHLVEDVGRNPAFTIRDVTPTDSLPESLYTLTWRAVHENLIGHELSHVLFCVFACGTSSFVLAK